MDLLKVGEVTNVVDVRTISRSRTNPQYNADTLPAALAAGRIEYSKIHELGGLRKRSKTVAPDVNGFWINPSFHNYADYALSAEFRTGLDSLIEIARGGRCAIMCAEAVWWRCHRRIIADYLLHREQKVFHLMGTSEAKPALMTPAARADVLGLVYPAVP